MLYYLNHGSLGLKKCIIISSKFVKNEIKKGTQTDNNTKNKNILLNQDKFNPMAFCIFYVFLQIRSLT